jgi:hypothetical protein
MFHFGCAYVQLKPFWLVVYKYVQLNVDSISQIDISTFLEKGYPSFTKKTNV